MEYILDQWSELGVVQKLRVYANTDSALWTCCQDYGVPLTLGSDGDTR